MTEITVSSDVLATAFLVAAEMAMSRVRNETTCWTDQYGKPAMSVSPQGRMALRKADLFFELAAIARDECE